MGLLYRHQLLKSSHREFSSPFITRWPDLVVSRSKWPLKRNSDVVGRNKRAINWGPTSTAVGCWDTEEFGTIGAGTLSRRGINIPLSGPETDFYCFDCGKRSRLHKNVLNSFVYVTLWFTWLEYRGRSLAWMAVTNIVRWYLTVNCMKTALQ
jgi:hypothetical protein